MKNDNSVNFTPTVRYFNSQLKYCKPIKSRSHERQLLRRAKKGDNKAQNEILTSNLRFVYNLALKYRGHGVPLEELISEGTFGMIYAIKKFDVDVDVKFITYAGYWIRFFMSDTIKKNKIRCNIECDEECVNPNSGIENSLKCSSIEEEADSWNLFSIQNGENKENLDRESKLLEKLFSVLNDRERDIIENYYGIGNKEKKNLEEISKKLKISKERVRQIKEMGLIKMKSEAMLFD